MVVNAHDLLNDRLVAAKRVAVCDTQPVTIEGVRRVLSNTEDLRFFTSCNSLKEASMLLHSEAPDVLVVDKAFGTQMVLDWLFEWRMGRADQNQTSIVVWGGPGTDAAAWRFLQAGAHGVLGRTSSPELLLTCLRTVASGHDWMEGAIFNEPSYLDRCTRPDLTVREQQVLELVEQGLKNKDIAMDLGISPGTVKIHLKHVFEKTGVHGRYGLALNKLCDRSLTAATSVRS